ncbi:MULTISPECIES: hypothetical protein [unclassified Ochrobactrum]|jgi:hypothetical protein|uniref:Ig-like domain-containing protein n=1 Tax=unclassified Ochrobactrum TaxID=239106 RepID=UPI000DEF9841|nr:MULTISPECIES: hypothetical protein [unclassified Ochrobactrum]MBQ0710307.1 hypothetical protein [Ochrobactrum sp. AP1BH01-1]
MKDIVEVSNQTFEVYQDKSQAKANYKDFITIQVIVKGDGGALLSGQSVLFSLGGSHARFRELANQKIIGTTDSSGTVTVHVMSNDLDKGTVTITIVDKTGQPLSGSKTAEYEFIRDPALGIAVAIEKSGAKADGIEQNIVAVTLTDSGQPLAYATVHARVDGKALFVPDDENETQATTDSRGTARFYLIDGNNLQENVNFTAYYELAQWLQATAVVPFSDAYNFDITTEVLSNFNTPGTSPNTVRIKLLNNNQVASGFDIACTLPAASGATFVKNGEKHYTGKTDKSGYLEVDINDTKVEKVTMEAYVVLQPSKSKTADLEWQKYDIQLVVNPNNSLPDGIAQNIITATLKNDGVLVPSEELVFKIDDRSKSSFVDSKTRTTYKTTASNGTASVGIVSNSSETYPVVVALNRHNTIYSSVNSAFGAYALTVLQVKNNANGDEKDENSVKVLLTNNNNLVAGKKLYCTMLNKKAVFSSNHQYTSEVTTNSSGEAIISMVGLGSFQDTLKVSVEDNTSVYKEVVLYWRKYTITQVNTPAKFTVGNTGVATVEVRDNGTVVGDVDVTFSSPYNVTQKTTSTGRVSASYYSSYATTIRSTAYVKDVPSVSVSTSIEFVEKYSTSSPTKSYVTWGYDLTFRVMDNGRNGPASYAWVDAYLTANCIVANIPQIWFENHVGNLVPTYKDYQTDGNGKVVIPIRYLTGRPTAYNYETLTLYIGSNLIATYGCPNA